MTMPRMLRALGRRWYVPLAGALVTGAVALGVIDATGVYTARTTLTFTPPVGWAVGGNTFTDSATSLVGFAKLVEQQVTDGGDGQLFAHPQTPLYGSGVREGEVLYVPDAGGQWASNFNRPSIVVDVVGAAPDEVAERVERLTAQVAETAQRLQDDEGVVASQRIAVYADPAQPEVVLVAPQRLRALAGVAVIGVVVSVAAALGLDAVARRVARRRAVTG